MALKKVYDETFKKGAQSEDHLDGAMRVVTGLSHKPTEEESDLVSDDIGDMSYFCILEKKN